MQINYTADAFDTLLQLLNFIENKNTKGAAVRWLDRYEVFLQTSLLNPSLRKYCHNQTLQKLKLHCLNYNDWTIAYSVHEKYVLIEALLHKSRIVD
jgi:plasmid stabilization system protein ParE